MHRKDLSRRKSAGRRGEGREIKRRYEDRVDRKKEEEYEKADRRLRGEIGEKRRRAKDGGEGRSVQGPLLVKQDQSLSS